MKKVIEDLAAKYKLQTAYAGAKRIMFIKGEGNKEFVAAVHDRYPALVFEVRAVDTFDKPKEETKSKYFPSLTVGEAQWLPLTEGQKTVENEIIAEEKEEERKLRIRVELDIYLTENPIDKSKKGFFVPIAEKFGVTSDYVRKRYNSLKERGLLKEETVNA